MPLYVEHLVVVALAVGLGWTLWRNSRPRALFAVRIIAGQAAQVDGTVTPAFLQRLREVAAAHGIDECQIAGVEHEGLIRLQFSRHVPTAARQQLRNWWAMHGWRAPRSASATRCG
jgi:hypothetical protein